MNLTPSEEQRLLRESADRFTADLKIKPPSALGDPKDRGLWKRFADMGRLALPLPAEHGGLDGGAVEISILMEAFGRNLVSEPYLATVVLGASLIDRLGTPAQKAQWLPKIAEGETILGFAHDEGRKPELDRVETRAASNANGWQINGRKSLALDAPDADAIIISARVAGDTRDPHGIGLFIVPRTAAGLTLQPFARLGGGSAAMLTMSNMQVPSDALLGDNHDALPQIAAALDRARAALCADALGAMQSLLDRTSAYTQQRVQFGKPLSFNQTVRHKLADMAVAVEEARSMALLAALRCDDEPVARGKACSGAKAKISKGGRLVAEQSVQLHGGMGVTEELDIGLFFKRLLAFESIFGSATAHYRQHAVLAHDTGLARRRANENKRSTAAA